MVKVEEGGGDTRGEWIHQAITTFFESDWKLWGNEASCKLALLYTAVFGFG